MPGRDVLWPHIPAEYREELQGIADGMKAAGTALDLWDVVALNASMEWSYYVQKYDKEHGLTTPKAVTAPDHCSAFVATGSYTKDGKFVIAHNNWTSYLGRPAVDYRVRRDACKRASLCDGWLSGIHPQRG